MDDNDFINDPIFNSLRKFSLPPEGPQIMPIRIRKAFREGIKSSKKRRFAWRGAIGAGLMVIAFPTFAAAKILPAPLQHIVENINRVITSPVTKLMESVAPRKKVPTSVENAGNAGNAGNSVNGSGDLGNSELNSALGDTQGNENTQESQNSNGESNASPLRSIKPLANQDNSASQGDGKNENQPANQEEGKPNLVVPNSLPTLANNLNPITNDSGISGPQGFSITGPQSDSEGLAPSQSPDKGKPEQVSGAANGADNGADNANN